MDRPLTDEDLKVDSPYNTRVVKGLPPAPICNPGVAALNAALEPADVDYLYYRRRHGRQDVTSPPRTTSSCKLKKNLGQ